VNNPAYLAAVEACKKFVDAPTRTIARHLCENRPKLFPTLEKARTCIRRIRGNNGNKSRKESTTKSMFRENGKAGAVTIPKSDAKEWNPLVLEGARRVGVLSDIHVPYHDKRAVETAIKECKRHRCDTIILNGDTLDFHGVSRFERDPEARSPAEEVRMTVKLMRYIQQQIPNARLIWKNGNHEDRWQKYIWENAPVIWQLQQCRLDGLLGYEYAEQTESDCVKLSAHGWEYVTDKLPILCGLLPILHGHELTAGSPVNPARGLYLRTSHTSLIGHHHATSQHTQADMFGREVATWSTGCLCDMRPLYMPFNRWNHGFAICDVSQDGSFDLRNLRISDGKIRAS